MKKIALTIQLCALLFTVYGQEQAFSISGDIELDKGQLLVLTQRPGKTDTLARTAIVGRKFDIRGTLDEAVVFHFLLQGAACGIGICHNLLIFVEVLLEFSSMDIADTVAR